MPRYVPHAALSGYSPTYETEEAAQAAAEALSEPHDVEELATIVMVDGAPVVTSHGWVLTPSAQNESPAG